MTSLKDRLAQATSKLFGSAVRDTVVPFELLCDCGHRVAGIRQTTDQIVTCSACRSSLYVLPKDVYPLIRSPRTESKSAPVSTRTVEPPRPPVEEVVETETTSVPDESADSGVSAPGDVRRRKSGRERSRKADLSPEPSPVEGSVIDVVAVPRKSLSERLKRIFSPTRLLAMALISLLIGTGWWMVQRQRLDQARRTWRAEMDRVEPALKDRDIGTLQVALQKAVEAARVLNRDDAEALEAESLLAQTNAVQSLTTVDLFATLSGAVNDEGAIDQTKAADASALLIGQRFVFDTTLKPMGVRASSVGTATQRAVPLMELNCPIVANSFPIRIGVASPTLNELTSSAAESSVLFIATIKSMRAPQNRGSSWQIELDGDSCVLITTAFHAEQCGYDVPSTEGLEERLKRQAVFIRRNGSSVEDENASKKDSSNSAGSAPTGGATK